MRLTSLEVATRIAAMTLQRTAIALLALAIATVCPGCRKKLPPTPPPYNINGVNVDTPKLGFELANASPEAKAQVTQAEMEILRFHAYDKAVATLSALANNPSLNDSQKKSVNEVIEQVKQLINQGGPK